MDGTTTLVLGPSLVEEFFSNYAASLLNSIEGTQFKKVKGQITLGRSPKSNVMVWGTCVNILETTINHFLFGPDYQAPLDGQFRERHGLIMDPE